MVLTAVTKRGTKMIKHIIIWDFIDTLSAEEKAEAAVKIKNDLEGLLGVVKGLREITVYTDMLSTSNGDIMLDSTVENEEALAEYAVHPAHVAVKDYIGTVVKSRKCVDFKTQ
jgi:hypothetical protein